MDHRSKNRYREHEPHGWYLIERVNALQGSRVFMQCPCGWFGWVDPKDEK